MSRNTEPDQIQEILNGVALLILCHILVGVITLLMVIVFFNSFQALIVGLTSVSFWQLLYVIPLILWLKRRGKVGMMKGVIIGAVITALLSGLCFLSMR